MAVDNLKRLARRRFQRLKRSRFGPEGRDARVGEAVRALDEAIVDYKLSPETMRWLAEDKDLEDV